MMALDQKSILILHDEPDIVTVIKHSLQNCGPRVFTFTSPFLSCLILSDLRKQGMNGFEFAKKMRDTDEKVKILLMSAF
jgi:CheY-like chemotaxis protein